MPEDPRTEPLKEWNRLSRELTENDIVSSMYEALLSSSESIETFSTWLLVASAAVASFFISNADKLLPFIQPIGFKVCGGFLIASCCLGFLSKIFALRCKMSRDATQKATAIFQMHLAKHQEEEKKIKENAEFWGITLETGVRSDRILQEFLKPAPFWVKWSVRRSTIKNEGNPQAGYLGSIKNYVIQGVFALLQSIAFLGFLISGFVFAQAV